MDWQPVQGLQFISSSFIYDIFHYVYHPESKVTEDVVTLVVNEVYYISV